MKICLTEKEKAVVKDIVAGRCPAPTAAYRHLVALLRTGKIKCG